MKLFPSLLCLLCLSIGSFALTEAQAGRHRLSLFRGSSGSIGSSGSSGSSGCWGSSGSCGSSGSSGWGGTSHSYGSCGSSGGNYSHGQSNYAQEYREYLRKMEKYERELDEYNERMRLYRQRQNRYTTPNNQYQTPYSIPEDVGQNANYGTRNRLLGSKPQKTPEHQHGRITLYVPKAATVHLGKNKMNLTGVKRNFSLPKLKSGLEYRYTITVSLDLDGKTIEHKHVQNVKLGDKITLKFGLEDNKLVLQNSNNPKVKLATR